MCCNGHKEVKKAVRAVRGHGDTRIKLKDQRKT